MEGGAGHGVGVRRNVAGGGAASATQRPRGAFAERWSGLALRACPSDSLRHTHHAPAPIFASDQMKKHFYGDFNQDQRYNATVHASSGGHMPLRMSLARTPQPGAWWFFQEDGLRVVPMEFLGRGLHGLTFSALSWAFLSQLGNTLSL